MSLLIPYVAPPGRLCPAVAAFFCTRPAGHTGRHAAGGGRQPDGRRRVFDVWGDPEVCS